MNTIKNNGFYNVKIIDKNIYITTTINGGSTTVQIPDEHFRQYLIDRFNNISTSSFNGNNEIDVSLVNTITSLNFTYKSITDLTGIEAFTALTYLNIYSTPITGNLDLSNKCLNLFKQNLVELY